MTSSAHETTSPTERSLLRQVMRKAFTKGDAGDTRPVHGTETDASGRSQDDSDTRGRDPDESSQGALLTMKRHQRLQLPVKKLPRRVRGVWTKNLGCFRSRLPSPSEAKNS